MSYAKAAAKGPEQSPEEARAPAQPKVNSSASSSLVDVDSPHVSTVPPNYEQQDYKTATQVERVEREEERAEIAEEQKEQNEKQKRSSEAKGKERADASRGGGDKKGISSCAALMRNKSNPVVLVNAFLVTAASVGLGYGAYQKHLRGALTWDMMGLWTGGLGAAAFMDYFVSRWFLQNKYPPK